MYSISPFFDQNVFRELTQQSITTNLLIAFILIIPIKMTVNSLVSISYNVSPTKEKAIHCLKYCNWL